jgi:hypothetical protein
MSFKKFESLVGVVALVLFSVMLTTTVMVALELKDTRDQLKALQQRGMDLVHELPAQVADNYQPNEETVRLLGEIAATVRRETVDELASEIPAAFVEALESKNLFPVLDALFLYNYRPVALLAQKSFTQMAKTLYADTSADLGTVGDVFQVMAGIAGAYATAKPLSSATEMPEYNTWLADLLLSIPVDFNATLSDTQSWAQAGGMCEELFSQTTPPWAGSYVGCEYYDVDTTNWRASEGLLNAFKTVAQICGDVRRTAQSLQ